MHWTERRRAKTNVGLALRARGWTLYGFHEDQSEPLTDYYSPASWHGVAEKDGYVVVVDVAPGSSLLKRSGNRNTTKQAQDDVVVAWPQFGVNPPHKNWHVETDERILDSGIGLGPCADYDKERSQSAVQQIVDRIEAAVAGNEGQTTTTTSTQAPVEGVTIRRNPERQGIEVIFPTKPGEEIRTGLKRLGFRWSKRQGLWYDRYSTSLWDQVCQFLNLDEADTRKTPEFMSPVRESPIPNAPTTSEPLPTETREHPPEIEIEGLLFTWGTNDAQQEYYSHRDEKGRSWHAIHHILRPDLAWFGILEDVDGATMLLTSATLHAHYEERDILYGQSDTGTVDPPPTLLQGMARLILADVDPFTVPKKRVPVTPTPEPEAAIPSEPEPLETRDPARMTRPEIVAEALRLDTIIRSSDHGFPAEVADRMEALRAAMFRLDPTINLDAELRMLRSFDVPRLVRDWKDLTRRLERGHGMRSNTRAAATTRNAHLGKLAQSRDQVLETLRIAVQQARDREEPVPSAIRAEPDLACILLGKPEAEASLDEAASSPANNIIADLPDDNTVTRGATRLTKPNPFDSLEVDGITWNLEITPDDRPIWTAEDKNRRLWSVEHHHGAGALTGKGWWTVQAEFDGRSLVLNTKIDGASEGPLYTLTDDEEPSPPVKLLRATGELIRIGYPNHVSLDGITWSCELRDDGTICYEVRRDPWWCFYVMGKPGHWEAYWYKPGDISTCRCLTQEKHSELEGEQDPLVILETLTRDIRERGSPPPRIVIERAEIAPRKDGGWDYAPLEDQDRAAPTPTPAASAQAGSPTPKPAALSASLPIQLSLF
jgi:hypothetical protein